MERETLTQTQTNPDERDERISVQIVYREISGVSSFFSPAFAVSRAAMMYTRERVKYLI